MKILFVSPCADEMRDGSAMLLIRKLADMIPECRKGCSSEILDLSSVTAGKVSLDEMLKITEGIKPLSQFDIVHAFSIVPFVFRGLFPRLMISSFDVETIDDKFSPFIPENDEPGYARHDISSLDATAVCELYPEVYNNRKEFDERPWGWWKSLVLSKNYKVKQIYVAPEAKLSLQTHKFRSEIWIISQGNGWVTAGDRRMTAEKGSVFNIGRGEVHRAEGGEGGLYIIELQIGDYLGEDDIIRLEDIYGRK